MYTPTPAFCRSSRRKKITRFLLSLSLLLLAGRLPAQTGYDPTLKPFYHGVASGDPMEDRVIIWTRVTPEGAGPVTVAWTVATDPALTRVVQSGRLTTDAGRDYTVKLDVAGLKPNTTYYYGFNALGRNSLTGRTKTTPVGDVSQLRFAVVSCNNFEGGYFNAFGRIADRGDLDAVIHLGDYIYEQAEGLYGAPSLITGKERPVKPKSEIVTLGDYRQRYAWYRLDPDLRRAHQQHPFITVWDDHESANDAYKDGAENHQPDTEGPWSVRKEVSRRVYDEWMPIRGDASPIYRVKPYGNLVDLIMIDTRIEGRDAQINDVTSPALYAANRTMLGQTQREWLFNRLKTSRAKWKIIGNQVIFSEFNVGWAAAANPDLGTPAQLESVFLDIWDGYPAERQRVIDFITKEKIDNVVVLTGDFHSSFAFDVAPNPSVFSVPGQKPRYDPVTGEGSVAVEFATPSISSANFDENLSPQQAALFEALFNQPLPPQAGPFAGVNPNPHLKYVDLDRHGYFILDITPEKAQADWFFVDDVLRPTNGETFDAGFYTRAGRNHLQKAPAASAPKEKVPAPAPGRPTTAGTAAGLGVRLLGTYASGIFDDGGAEIPAYDPGTKRLFVVNAQGTVDVLSLADPAKPAKLFALDLEALAGGTPNSVDVKNGLVAVAVQREDDAENQVPGVVAFFPANLPAPPAAPLNTVPVGALPDMLTFSPDGSKVLVANEGEPGPTLNPEGSISLIDLAGGVAGATVKTVSFAAWNGREAELRAKGVRLFPGQKAAEDLEPEYIAVSPDGKRAFVTLQEANAFAVVDVPGAALLDLIPLGTKDYRAEDDSLGLPGGSTLDASDRDNAISLRHWPVRGMYMPDGVSAYTANGQTYYITANEGDTRDEDERVGELTLDPIAFPDSTLKRPDKLGRLTVSTIDGDPDGDGDYDGLYTYGARSFSIWDSAGKRVFDSGDQLERITAAQFPQFFNASNDNNTFDNRSDDKGPEPEGVAVGVINGRTYAFVGLERIGGFMVYDVTDPARAQFVEYTNNRNFDGDPEAGTAGDLGPEGILFIPAGDSPTGADLLVVANEVSGTTSVYGITKKQVVTGFTLVDAGGGRDIGTLADGAVIDYAQLSARPFNVRAEVSPDSVGSVVFTLDGQKVRPENLPPYSLRGDGDGYAPWTPAPGTYTLTATPYAAAGGTGAAGTPLTITFTVTNSAKIAKLTLVNARTAADIRTVKDGDVVNLRTLPARRINLRADADPSTVGSVVFKLETDGGAARTQVENLLPYALFGNVGTTAAYNPYRLETGRYRLTVTPYAGPGGKGAPGTPSTVAFRVVDEPAVARLLLVDVAQHKVLTEIRDGDTLRAAALGITPGSNLNIVAETAPRRVEKVLFDFAGQKNYAVEEKRPYELFGDGGSATSAWRPVAGTYDLTATPLYREKGSVMGGTPLAVRFTIVTGAAAARTAAAGTAKETSFGYRPLGISVSPNPVRDQLTIRFAEPPSGQVLVMVYDILGRKTYYEKEFFLSGQHQVQVNLAGLASRFYLLKVVTGAGRQTVRIIKE